MKVVWLVSGDDTLVSRLQKEFDRSGSSYLVRHALKIPQIPVEHLSSNGVAAMIDSFHIEHAGFAGLKQLRELGFNGPIYMFGEPAPEKTTEPFTKFELSGFFPAIERADLSYIAGIVHHCFELNGDLNLKLLLNQEHKSGSAKITKHEDLGAITQKLSVFASRFGVKEDILQKTIMGLCMGHIQTKHGESQISEPFELRFGTDRNKIVLSVPSHSKGNHTDVLRSEFAQALANFHNSELKNSALFQEFHHLVKAVNNLSIFGGSAAVDTEFPDPMHLVTRIPFGIPAQADSHPGYYFSIHHTKPTDNLESVTASLPLITDSNSTPTTEPILEKSTVTVHSEKDLHEILTEPVVMGDALEAKGEKIPLNAESSQLDNNARDAKITDDEMIVNKHFVEKLRSDVKELKSVNETMAQDIFKLMKERKEPTVDTELRKQNEELKAKAEKMEIEFDAAIKALNRQIEELKNKDAAPKADKSTDKKDAKKAA